MECVVHASNGDDTVTEDENSVDRTDVLLDKCYNTLLVDLLVLITTQPRCVENTNLEKWLRIETAFKNIGTYQYTAVAINFHRGEVPPYNDGQEDPGREYQGRSDQCHFQEGHWR